MKVSFFLTITGKSNKTINYIFVQIVKFSLTSLRINSWNFIERHYSIANYLFQLQIRIYIYIYSNITRNMTTIISTFSKQNKCPYYITEAYFHLRENESALIMKKCTK